MDKIHLKPGSIHFSREPVGIQTVVTFGICITVFDKRSCIGGVAHFLYPFRVADKPSTALFAAPCIIGLLKVFEDNGSHFQDLEVSMYGGAHPENAQQTYLDHCQNNVLVAHEILDKKELKVSSEDLGGYRGRKLVFDTSSGEAMIAKVDGIRSVDWMLSSEGPIER